MGEHMTNEQPKLDLEAALNALRSLFLSIRTNSHANNKVTACNVIWKLAGEGADEIDALIARVREAEKPMTGDWVLVPREPTREMWAAMGNAFYGHRNRHHDAVAKDFWNAVLSTSPSTPKPSELTAAFKKTMTLHLTDEEMAALEAMAKAKEMEPPTIFRQALKLYQLRDHEAAHGPVPGGPLGLTAPSTPKAGDEGAWRPEVRAFADLMEAQLRANDHKPGWKGEEASDLFPRIAEEADELWAAMVRHAKRLSWGDGWVMETNTVERIGAEAADVANFAMMIADVCGALALTAGASNAEGDVNV